MGNGGSWFPSWLNSQVLSSAWLTGRSPSSHGKLQWSWAVRRPLPWLFEVLWLCGHEFSFLCCWRHEREGSHYLGTDIVSFGLPALQSLVKRVPWADSSCFVARWFLCPMRVSMVSQLVWQDFDWISSQHSGRIQSAPGVPGSNDLQP